MLEIVHSSPEWLWLHKPAGLSVFPRHGAPESDCVLARLLDLHPEQAQGFPQGFEGGIAHRLDIPTSGLLLVAKTPSALVQARAAFSGRRLKKSYRFLSEGQLKGGKQACTLPIAHHPKNRRKMVCQTGARTRCRGRWYPAQTTLRHIRGRLFEAVITTGVMHQIRAHAAQLGAPLLGDTLYGGPSIEPPGFYLHHAHMQGLGACPFLAPPTDWPVD